MRLNIIHETHYRFEEPANHSIQYLRLTPRQDACQRVLEWNVSATGGDRTGSLVYWVDGFGNGVHVASLTGPHDDLRVVVEGRVETYDTIGVLPFRDGVPPLVFMRDTPFTTEGPRIEALAGEVRSVLQQYGPLAALHALMEKVADACTYNPGATTTETTAEEALEQGAGVCQDHAHIMIAGARVLGIPARYVSGYILDGSDGKNHAASHAWAEASMEGLGWVSFDPSNRQSATDAYVRLAIGFDHMGAAPVRGTRFGDGAEEMSVKVTIEQSQSQS